MKKFDIRKRFLKLAYEQLNPNLGTIEGLEQALTNWYCFQYNVPPNDDKLLDMTVEELLVLNYMHKLKDNPHLADEISSESGDYEDWLKKEMGDNYTSIEDMVKDAEKLDQEDKELMTKMANELPDRITTDFTKLEE